MKIVDDARGPNRSNPSRLATASERGSPDSVPEVPPINVISSAPFFEAERNQDRIPIPAAVLRRHNIRVVQVKGNSMIQDDLFDGDQVIVETRGAPRDGELVLAVIGNRETILRRFHCHEGRIRLESPNPSHKALIFDEKNVDIHGVVVGILRRYTG